LCIEVSRRAKFERAFGYTLLRRAESVDYIKGRHEDISDNIRLAWASLSPREDRLAFQNIVLQEMADQKEIQLTNNLKIIPFTVPHRDEFSETVGYTIIGPLKKVLFIPDIDKWEKWSTNIIDAVAKVDYAFVDATFYDGEEINNRDISTIPHPFIIESMDLFKDLPAAEKKKIYFIHFNHTNPVINKTSKQYQQVIEQGFNVAAINTVIRL
jgi:pyrroloquinoline quinone biosynthesis protein B